MTTASDIIDILDRRGTEARTALATREFTASSGRFAPGDRKRDACRHENNRRQQPYRGHGTAPGSGFPPGRFSISKCCPPAMATACG